MILSWLLIIAILVAVTALLSWRLVVAHKSLRQEKTRAQQISAGAGALYQDRDRLKQILAYLGEGILITDTSLRPRDANRAAREIFGWGDGLLPQELPSRELGEAVTRLLEHPSPPQEVISYPYPRATFLGVRASRIGGSEIIVFLNDVTSETQASRLRKEFVAHASHELKTPVASLQALAEAVANAVEDDPGAAVHFSRRMTSEAERLGMLISDLLDLSRLEETTDAPSCHVCVTDVVAAEVRDARPLAVDKFIGLHLDVEPDLWARGDAAQLGLMLRNLLLNAISYTPRGGTVDVRGWGKGDGVVLEVADNGIGIPKEAQGRVFERFFRVDSGRSRAAGGTGLGLAIVKHVVEVHRGHISLKSEPGQGSTFTIWLPHRVRAAVKNSAS